MAGIFFLAWDEDTPDPRDYYDDPDPCPACGDLGYIEDEEGFTTDCKTCDPFNDDELYAY